MLIYIYIGLTVGGVLGITGAGGSMIALPALVSLAGLSIHQAMPISLIAIASGASIGAISGIRKGIVRYKAALLMVSMGIPFSFVGIYVSKKLPQNLLFILFALVMLIVATRLILANFNLHSELSSSNLNHNKIISRINPRNGRFEWNWITGIFLSGVGALAGFMSGLIGVGGGFIIVPLLKRFTNVSMHGVVATSLMVIALVSCGGVISSVIHGIHPPSQTTMLFSLSTISGMLIGRKLSVKISERHTQLGFSYILIAIAIFILIKNVVL
ncbi:MAG: hypothetical protein RLZZ210_592 [Pseudomonadota bacterium]|jgi:uncharacterized membrane protein YfcA